MNEAEETIVSKLKAKLGKIAHFEFIKKDGSTREAFGTLNQELIPKYDEKKVDGLVSASYAMSETLSTGINEKNEVLDPDSFDVHRKVLGDALTPFQPKEYVEKEKPENLIIYYDLESKGWRQCYTDSVVKVY